MPASRSIAAAAATTTTVAAAAAAATTVAATAAAGATAAAAATAIAAATAARLAWLGLVDRQPATFIFLIVQALDRRLGLRFGVHLDKTEALASTGVAVLNDLRALHRPVLGEPSF